MTFPRSTPEQQGVSSAAISRFVDALEGNLRDIHSMMLVRHGHVIAEGWWGPYQGSHPHSLFSISKSFVSTAIGFAIDEGLLTLDDAIVDLLPDDVPENVSDNLDAMCVRHLLTMTTGHATDSVAILSPNEHNWAKTILAIPVAFAPGTTFVYDTGATYLLSAILQRLTGLRVLDYLRPRLFEPLGISGATWEQCPRGIDVGGWGLAVTTEDIAAFGQTYLAAGVWNGTQVIPAQWTIDATRLQVANGDFAGNSDSVQGYGFQFWRNRHDTYRADGAFGQMSIAFPHHDALLVLTGGLGDSQAELNVVWDHLLPVMGAHEILPPDATAAAALTHRLENLVLPLPDGTHTSATAERVSGTTYALPRNAAGIVSVALAVTPDVTTLTVVDATGSHDIVCGRAEWSSATSSFMASAPAPIAAAGAWADDDSFVARVYFCETPFAVTISLDFFGTEVTVGAEQNVSFGPTQLVHTNAHAV